MISNTSYSKNTPCFREQFFFIDKLIDLPFAGQFYFMGAKLKFNVGDKYGRLTILKEIEPYHLFNKKRNKDVPMRLVLCQCDCGKQSTPRLTDLLRGKVKSCHCLTRENDSKNLVPLSHGLSRHKNRHSLYPTYIAMIHRCYRENNHAYNRYGGRGISVCKEWHDPIIFCKWAEDNGWEKGLSLDRINNDGNYEPSNCRWADKLTQANNTSSNKYITLNGEVISLANACRKVDMPYRLIQGRMKKGAGMSFEQAISKPIRIKSLSKSNLLK